MPTTGSAPGSSARLFQLLRIEKGYTYGAGSVVPRLNEVAPFYAATSVRANVTLESLELIREQIRNYRETYTEDDLRTTKNLLAKQATRDFETLDDLISVLEDITRFDLPLDFIDRGLRELDALTLEQVHATIARYLDESRMVYVVVGDGATQRERSRRARLRRPGDPGCSRRRGRTTGSGADVTLVRAGGGERTRQYWTTCSPPSLRPAHRHPP